MTKISLVLFYISFFSYIMFVVGCYLKCSTNNKNIILRPIHILSFLIGYTLLSIFGVFSGDYPHYEEILYEVANTNNAITHLEPIYVWLIQVLDGNSCLWRATIAVFSYSTLFIILKKSNCLDFLTLFVFGCLELSSVINGRQPASLLLFYLGIILMITSKRYFIGIFLIVGSIFLHKSGIMGFLLIPFLLFDLNKRNIIISLIFLPVLIFLEIKLLNFFLSSPEMELAGSAYFTMDAFSQTLLVKVNYICTIFCSYSIAILVLFRASKISLSNLNQKMSRCLYGGVYITSIIYFLPIDQMSIFDRSIQLWWIPVILLANVIQPPRLNLKLPLFYFLLWGYFLLRVSYLLLMFRNQAYYYA